MDDPGARQADATNVDRRPASLWRRFLAFALDCLAIAVFGWLISLALFDWVASLGVAGRFIGLTLTLVYFGISDSRFSYGCSVGKSAFGIRVVGRNGQFLSAWACALRTLILTAPLFIYGLPFSDIPKIVSSFVSLLVFGVLASSLYLFVFNTKSRQSLHDLAAGSMVLRGEGGRPTGQPLWRGHWVIIGGLCVGSMLLPWFATPIDRATGANADLWSLRQSAMMLADARNAGVSRGYIRLATVKEGALPAREFLRVTVILKGPKNTDDLEKTAHEVAEMVLRDYRDTVGSRVLVVVATSTADLGIFTSRRNFQFQTTAESWPQPVLGFFPG